MGWFSHDSEEARYHDEFHNQAKPSHEAMGGAAAFYAAHEYEKHLKQSGKPVDHAKAKELLAGFSGAFIDREAETHGLNLIQREKAKHDAKKRAERAYENNSS